ncbi:MAG: polymer-forming cytoskeletal protein [Thermonemataceae bacterium]
MAMFGNNAKEMKGQEIDKISNASTNLGKGATLQGNVDTYGNVRVDGKLIGDVRSQSKVATGNASLIEGSIFAQNAEVEGEVKGRVEVTDLLVLKSTAIVHGDIVTGKLVIEAGAIFNGSCQMGDVNKIKTQNLNKNIVSAKDKKEANTKAINA